jgi:hypothetical protein
MKLLFSALFCILNIYFSYSQIHFNVSINQGCAPLEVSFTNNNPSNGFAVYPWIPIYGCDYNWDFGNGVISSSENPLSVFYYEPGVYTVYYEAIIDTVGFVLSDVNILSTDCWDFGLFGAGDPDVYFDLYDASINIVYHSGHDSDQLPPLHFSDLNIPLNNPPYSIAVMDSDTDGDDNCIDDSEHNIAVPINFPDIDEECPITQTASQGGLSFEYTIYKTIQRYTDSIIIHVYETPNIQQLLTTTGENVICDGQSIFLQGTENTNYHYTWFNETGEIATGSNICEVNIPGEYFALVHDVESGMCFDYSDTIMITEGSLPQGFNIFGLEDSISYLHSTYLTAQLYRWHKDNLFVHESTHYNLNNPTSGEYFVEIITEEGCRDTSNSIAYFPVSVNSSNINSNFTLFPNPASDVLSIKCIESQSLKTEIIDLSGKLIYSKDYSSVYENEIIEIPIHNLTEGLYFIRLREKDQISTHKFIKTNKQ